MRYSGTWLTPEDEAVLESLRDEGPASPAELERRGCVPFSERYIQQRCAALAGRAGLVSFDREVYRLSQKGTAYLEGDLDPSKLDPE